MTAQLPVVLAALGAVFMAFALFAPAKAAVPPPAAAPIAGARAAASDVHAEPQPQWPNLVDPTACACDAAARVDLVAALAAVGGPWAGGVLARAACEERDPRVRAALDAASAAAPALSAGLRYVPAADGTIGA